MTDQEQSRWESLKAQGRSYIDASRPTRGTIREAALLSVLSDAQEQIARGNFTGANESINVAKLLAIDEDLAAFAAEAKKQLEAREAELAAMHAPEIPSDS